MMVIIIETIFSLGLFINAALFIPQIMRLHQKKDSKELSLLTFGGFNFIQLFTILHGYLHQDYLLMGGFIASFITCGIVTGMIVYYRLVN
ncbi:MAG: PQ-loop domain-containing transporter [Gammaproteobacteria bacterium]|jgi:MtN3 and saliva related transmembrane protein